jgi:hypothetical protein
MPDKLTDSEIKKALKEYVDFADFAHIEYTAIRVDVLENALDLTNRLQANKEYYKKNRDECQDKTIFLSKQCDELQAENERLRKERGNQSALWSKHYEDIFETGKEIIKAEAYKEFAERLKAVSHPYADTQMVFELQIDNLLKELIGE